MTGQNPPPPPDGPANEEEAVGNTFQHVDDISVHEEPVDDQGKEGEEDMKESEGEVEIEPNPEEKTPDEQDNHDEPTILQRVMHELRG